MAVNPQIQNLLDDLSDLAMNAKMVGGPAGQALAVDLEALVAKHSGGEATPATPEPAAAELDADDLGAAIGIAVTEIAEQQRAAREAGHVNPVERIFDAIAAGDLTAAEGMIQAGPFGAPMDGVEDEEDDEHDVMAGLANQINAIGEEQLRTALPQSMTLLVRSPNGVPVAEDVALQAAADVLPSLVAVVGPLDIDGVDYADEDVQARVTLTVGEGNTGERLAALGAGREGFSATIADAHGDPLILVGTPEMPADAELAGELGTLPADLPEVPEGQHAINGVLQLVEDVTGERPVAQPEFTVRYSKDNGAELTEAEVEQILAHPVSQGLARFGAYQYLETVPGDDPSVKVARFALLEDGEINLATVALAATAYRGTFNFGGTIGLVSANAQAQLVDADIDVEV